MKRRVLFYQTFYNFVRPHMSLRLPLSPHQECTALFKPRWQNRTPAMAAGLTNHVWSFREFLTVKFEPIYFQSTGG